MRLSTRQRLALAAVTCIGLAIGLGAFTFGYARGYSYLSNDPAACANCHIMSEHFAAWNRSSHKAVATCNSCHTPHALLPKYWVKAQNGFWHSFYFTTGRFPDPLRITPGNRRVTERACRECHQPMVDAIDPPSTAHAGVAPDDRASCIRCHQYVGHLVR